jgi:hypothetical protein
VRRRPDVRAIAATRAHSCRIECEFFCATSLGETDHVTEPTLIIGHPRDGRAPLTRMPDGLRLAAKGWDDVWAACPEIGVPWQRVRFENDDVRGEIVAVWGAHPDMPS